MSKRGRKAGCVRGSRDRRGRTLLCVGTLSLWGGAFLAYAQPSLSVSPTAQAVLAGGGALTAQVTAGAAWTALTNASWITLNTTSGTGNGPLQYQVAANPSGNPQRVGAITITSQGLQATVGSEGVSLTEAVGENGQPVGALRYVGEFWRLAHTLPSEYPENARGIVVEMSYHVMPGD